MPIVTVSMLLYCRRIIFIAMIAVQPRMASDDPPEATTPDRPYKVAVIDAAARNPKSIRHELHKCLAMHYVRPCDTFVRSPWTVMHSLLAYGVDAQVVTGDQHANAISWLCWNRPCRAQYLLSVVNDALQTHNGPGLQGHSGQFLAMLAQARVRPDYPMQVDGRDFTVADLIEHEQRSCASKEEMTFKLLGLSYYLDSDATWKNQSGEPWSLSRLIREELSQPVVDEAACGGTHRLMALSYAVRKREKEAGAMNGQWKRAEQFVNDFHDYAFMVQNPDGSFSTQWFRARAADLNVDRRLQTTGHILEWLVFSLPADKLTQPRVTKSIRYLTGLMLENAERDWAIGPKGHALHALALYDERVFGSKPGRRGGILAGRTSNRQVTR